MLALTVLPALDLPAFADPRELADFLGLDDATLQWLADCDGRERHRRPTGRHYHYSCTKKSDGGERLLEAPKARLKIVQRRVLHDILDRVPPHEAAHGFVRRRSAVTGAALHTGRAMVIRLDLRDFFASIPASRIHAMFGALGYSLAVRRLLTGLCTNAFEFRAQLRGRIEWCAVNPMRRAKLRALFDTIDWASTAPRLPS